VPKDNTVDRWCNDATACIQRINRNEFNGYEKGGWPGRFAKFDFSRGSLVTLPKLRADSALHCGASHSSSTT